MANGVVNVSDQSNWRTKFLDPVVLIAISILFAIFFLILAAILGFDRVLNNMGKVEFARGLITYLFAVVTIGTAVVLVVSALTSSESDAHKEQFQRGKEVLALLLGVFGTIVGFYFGSEVSAARQAPANLQLAPLHLSAASGTSGASISIQTFIGGGTPPYNVGFGFDNVEIKPSSRVDSGGWISRDIVLPNEQEERALALRMVVEDSDGHRTEQQVPILVKPAPSTSQPPPH